MACITRSCPPLLCCPTIRRLQTLKGIEENFGVALDLSTEGRAVVFSDKAENVAGAVKLVRELVHEIQEVRVLAACGGCASRFASTRPPVGFSRCKLLCHEEIVRPSACWCSDSFSRGRGKFKL